MHRRHIATDGDLPQESGKIIQRLSIQVKASERGYCKILFTVLYIDHQTVSTVDPALLKTSSMLIRPR